MGTPRCRQPGRRPARSGRSASRSACLPCRCARPNAIDQDPRDGATAGIASTPRPRCASLRRTGGRAGATAGDVKTAAASSIWPPRSATLANHEPDFRRRSRRLRNLAEQAGALAHGPPWARRRGCAARPPPRYRAGLAGMRRRPPSTGEPRRHVRRRFRRIGAGMPRRSGDIRGSLGTVAPTGRDLAEVTLAHQPGRRGACRGRDTALPMRPARKLRGPTGPAQAGQRR